MKFYKILIIITKTHSNNTIELKVTEINKNVCSVFKT